MKTPNLPYIDTFTTKGKTYFYFRRGKLRIRLPDAPDTAIFSQQYWALRSGAQKAAPKTTWGQLIISYYQSPSFRNLSAGTKGNYRRHCEEIRQKNNTKNVRDFRRKHAIAARDALSEKWSKANERVAVLSVLCRHAVDLEWIERNPVTDIEKLRGGEYEAWPEIKLTAYEKYCAEHDKLVALTVYELAIGTGQRLGDCINMKWSDFSGDYVHVQQEKTKTKIDIYCPDRLRDYLNVLPKSGAYILAKNLTQPLGKRAVQKAVEEVREAIGVMNGATRLVPHGWRYTAAKQLADAGVSDADIQSVTGHKTLAMVQKYRAQANQRIGSKRAQIARERNENET